MTPTRIGQRELIQPVREIVSPGVVYERITLVA